MLSLKIKNKNQDVQEIAIKNDDSLVIGRDPHCDICLDDSQISRRHAKIICENGRIRITDLGSANGTFINEQRITERELSHEDTVRLGDHTLKLQTLLPETMATPRFERGRKLNQSIENLIPILKKPVVILATAVVLFLVMIIAFGGNENKPASTVKKSDPAPQTSLIEEPKQEPRMPEPEPVREPRPDIESQKNRQPVASNKSKVKKENRKLKKQFASDYKTKQANKRQPNTFIMDEGVVSKSGPTKSVSPKPVTSANKRTTPPRSKPATTSGNIQPGSKKSRSVTNTASESQSSLKVTLTKKQIETATSLYYKGYQIMAYKTKERYILAIEIFKRVQAIAPDPYFEYYKKAGEKLRQLEEELKIM